MIRKGVVAEMKEEKQPCQEETEKRRQEERGRGAWKADTKGKGLDRIIKEATL